MTEYTEIKNLLERYFEGETSLDEERVLQNYFAAGEVLPEFKQYAPMFAHFEKERKIKLDTVAADKINPISNGKVRRTTLIAASDKIRGNGKEQNANNKWQMFSGIKRKILLRVAAILFFTSGATWFFVKQNSSILSNQPLVNQHKRKAKVIIFDGSEDPKRAFDAVKSALVLTSNKMKIGTDPMSESLEKFSASATILK